MDKLIYSVKLLCLLMLCFFPLTKLSADPVNTPESLEFCTVCHGSQLMGNANISAPRLSALPPWYIEQQLYSFKNDWRGIHVSDVAGAEMNQMVSGLSDEDITAIAMWVSQTESPMPEPSIIGDAAVGSELYETCAVCHGESAEGIEALGAPPLIGLNDWYLKTQLEHFRNKVRGIAIEDTKGLLMQTAVSNIQNDEDIDNLIAYINQLSQP